MFDFSDILHENFSNYTGEVQEIMKAYNDAIREGIKEALVLDFYNDMKSLMGKDAEEAKERLSLLMNNGWKGYKELSTKALLDAFLERHSQDEFAHIMEKIKL